MYWEEFFTQEQWWEEMMLLGMAQNILSQLCCGLSRPCVAVAVLAPKLLSSLSDSGQARKLLVWRQVLPSSLARLLSDRRTASCTADRCLLPSFVSQDMVQALYSPLYHCLLLPQGRSNQCLSHPTWITKHMIFSPTGVVILLVCQGCHDKIPQTGWLNNRHTFSHSSGG